MSSKETKTPIPTAASGIWGGRFASGPAAIMEEINASIGFDQRLAPQDITGSKAHAAMLAETGIISKQDAKKIEAGLDTILSEVASGDFQWRRDLEDVHMNIETRLSELIGAPAGRLHTARSRNDQVATDFRLYVRDAIDRIDPALAKLQLAFARKAEKYADWVMPGYTHLQTAQPVTFGHHCLAYVEMLARDRSRFQDARARMNESPLGAAALAGTSFPIDRTMTAAALGFDRPAANSLDSVADRDFALEVLAAMAISGMHLSRFAEEVCIFVSAEFRFLRLSDRFTTGSSIMPQKRNPDAAELVRAKVGRLAGAFQTLMMVMKGLPLTYSKDMQEDKEATFDALDTFALMVAATTGMVDDMEPVRENLKRAAGRGFSTATDLADWCVQALNIPFRQAHHIAGKAVAEAEKRTIQLEELPLDALQAIEPGITRDVFARLGVENSVASRTSYGGTAPQNVAKSASLWIKRLEKAGKTG